MTGARLSQADVARLLADPSPEARSATARRIAAEIDVASLSPTERGLAEQILRIMVRDAEVRVREALSLQLRQTPNVPRDVALALARDVESVALPMIEFSEVLTDGDLIEIIRGDSTTKQVAVARRRQVSEPVSAALVETRDEAVVTTLVGNEGAQLSEAALRRIVEDFGDREGVSERVALRPGLPVTVAERLVTKVSETIRRQLLKRPEFSAALADSVMLQARERAVLGLTDGSHETSPEALVDHLRRHNRLTPSIVLRALCMGDVRFFEASLARRAGIPLPNARTLIHDAGSLGLDALMEKAEMPAAYRPAARAAIAAADAMQLDGEAHDRERFSRLLMERVLTQYGDLGVSLESGDLEYLLGKIGEIELPGR